MHLILELVPNHSSDQHEWFMESRLSKDSPFSDYYIWADGDNGEPPNNWISMYGGSAWTYMSARNQWYLHTFSENEPDLNYRNPMVEKEMTVSMNTVSISVRPTLISVKILCYKIPWWKRLSCRLPISYSASK
ncbi:oligo-1,6-glucosidase-like [Anneissia japonica]|uniref:oligo-1,6-glucosidase-like n=1 Tax=Anneissia japonica TaxID=1529436 RepID=UPI0014258A7A|nr:oligo-1,6-glucosidase-like [Anneissia japonica]